MPLQGLPCGRDASTNSSAPSCSLRMGSRSSMRLDSAARRPASSLRHRSRPRPVAAQAAAQAPPAAGSMREMSAQMRSMRADLESNQEVAEMMSVLRGANLSDADFADESVTMRLVEVSATEAGGDDALPLVYDPEAIAAYWSKRPVAVATRITQLLGIAGGFLTKVLADAAAGRLEETQVQRAIDLRNIMTSLGPAYIKLGQALSIRPDLLSPAAMNEMQKLCDKVPSFDSAVAMEMISSELGRPWQEVYSELTPEPIAAASLGQVYKGRLLSTGEQVAVKVQRPGVLETVTVDLFIIRQMGLLLRRFPKITARADIVALLDEWAARFFEELDYVREGENATKFAAMMLRDLPQVVVPRTYADFTTRRVLTSEWLEGEKLSQSQAADVGQLVNVGVICYLKQLLDTGFFHADPHPGNLIRTPDGRLAVLDFGLMTEIDDSIKYGMIDAISHLIHRDYEAIGQDFVALQFIPPGTDLRPILPVLAKVFDQALAGGGAKSINFQELAADLAMITYKYPFRIPPYFALIIRAIGVLEGIALVGDPDFAIVDEAFPFISKMLMTDDNPRLRDALRYMVYGRGETFDADRLIDLLSAFESFTVHASSARGDMDSIAGSIDRSMSGSVAGSLSGSISGSMDGGDSSSLALATTSGRGGGSGSILGSGGGGGGGLAGLVLSGIAAPLAATFRAGGFPGAVAPPSALGAPRQQDGQTREALRFLFSQEGTLFRDFLTDEVVKAVDALSRDQLRVLLGMLGLQNLMLPVVIPGARRLFVPLAPPLNEDDRRTVENVAKITNFLAGGSVSRLLGAEGPSALAELLPLLPGVATQMAPEIARKLFSRISARALREIFV